MWGVHDTVVAYSVGQNVKRPRHSSSLQRSGKMWSVHATIVAYTVRAKRRPCSVSEGGKYRYGYDCGLRGAVSGLTL
jgi:hypothetical protein